jgi:hypothetical protein
MLAEEERLKKASARTENWQRWGPYLPERQWGTVREDYSADEKPWESFTHDEARSRAYRWGEDGLLGLTDRECRLCFALALWNGRDPILKERLFGLSNTEGNHGEDAKECYYYLDAVPTYAYMKALYKYPQAEYPYDRLVLENRERGRDLAEFEITDTGVFDADCYFDVFVEYAKAAPDDICIRITVANRARESAVIHLLPTLWFRNTWSWGCLHEGCWVKPSIRRAGPAAVIAQHATLGTFQFEADPGPSGNAPQLLFTDNETNTMRLYGAPNSQPYVRDAFHEFVIHGKTDAVEPSMSHGTKCAAWYRMEIPARAATVIRCRLRSMQDQSESMPPAFDNEFDQVFAERIAEAEAFYATRIPDGASEQEQRVFRQAFAGLLWSKQFYHYIVKDWLEGDPAMPPSPENRKTGRNFGWTHLFNRDVISVPDKWEYPWYAAWDLAFHMVSMSALDPEFAKAQLLLFLREWYMHANGQIPAYEFALSDVNPPVHAWACWRVYKIAARRGERDRMFLVRAFHKLLINFTWWVNRKDPADNNIFTGGFLGLDNIGVFDRSQPLPGGGYLQQADATAWMAFYCATMLSIALELARENPVYEDVASKFFEHFVAITDAMNSLGGNGLWDEEDGFYYDQIALNGATIPLKIRSLVGIVPLFAVEVLENELIEKLPGFTKRMNWFLENRRELMANIAYMEKCPVKAGGTSPTRLLAIPSKDRLTRVLRYLLDENEFLSPYGIRSLSRAHLEHPYVFRSKGHEYCIRYTPGESDSGLFGGNSNWRGPVWFPLNYLIIEALERYHHFYDDSFTVECPVGSGRTMNLGQVANELARRLASLFLPDANGRRPCHGTEARYAQDPHWRDLILFYEYFNGDTGQGCGANHQTGWTTLVARALQQVIRARQGQPSFPP